MRAHPISVRVLVLNDPPAWHGYLQTSKRSRAAAERAERMCRRVLLRGIAGAFFAWADRVRQKHAGDAVRRRSDAIVHRLKNRDVCRALNAWAAKTRERGAQRRALAKVGPGR